MSGCGNGNCEDGRIPILDGIIYPGRAGPTLRPTGEIADCPICLGTGEPESYKTWLAEQRAAVDL